jgi:hypothetical protein
MIRSGSVYAVQVGRDAWSDQIRETWLFYYETIIH